MRLDLKDRLVRVLQVPYLQLTREVPRRHPTLYQAGGSKGPTLEAAGLLHLLDQLQLCAVQFIHLIGD